MSAVCVQRGESARLYDFVPVGLRGPCARDPRQARPLIPRGDHRYLRNIARRGHRRHAAAPVTEPPARSRVRRLRPRPAHPGHQPRCQPGRTGPGRAAGPVASASAATAWRPATASTSRPGAPPGLPSASRSSPGWGPSSGAAFAVAATVFVVALAQAAAPAEEDRAPGFVTAPAPDRCPPAVTGRTPATPLGAGERPVPHTDTAGRPGAVSVGGSRSSSRAIDRQEAAVSRASRRVGWCLVRGAGIQSGGAAWAA